MARVFWSGYQRELGKDYLDGYASGTPKRARFRRTAAQRETELALQALAEERAQAVEVEVVAEVEDRDRALSATWRCPVGRAVY